MQIYILTFSLLCLIVCFYYTIYVNYFLNIQLVNYSDSLQIDWYSNKSSESTFPHDVINSSTLNDYCEVNGEWFSLGTQIFFKKAAAYYLIDLDIIYLNLITLKNP